MPRNKVSLTYIQNSTKRRTTYRKRKEGIKKKVVEITTLCDIEACLVLYSEFDAQPLVWPSIDEVRRLIMKFQSSSSNVDQVKRMVNQETLTRERIQKIEDKLRKLQGENRRKEIIKIMSRAIMDSQTVLPMLDRGDYEELARVTNENLTKVQRMMEIRGRQESSFNPPPPQGGADGSRGGQHLVSMPNMTFPPPPVMTFPFQRMSFPTANMKFSLPPPQGRAGNYSGAVDDDQQLVLRNEFMSPNYHERFRSLNLGFSMPNQTFHPPPTMIMPFSPQSMSFPTDNMVFSFPPPQGGAGNNGVEDVNQQLALRNEFMSPNYHEMFQSSNLGFSMTNQMFPPPPIMPFSSQSMSFPTANMGVFPLSMDSPLNDVAYIDPNMAMPYPSNQSNAADMGPHDPSSSH